MGLLLVDITMAAAAAASVIIAMYWADLSSSLDKVSSLTVLGASVAMTAEFPFLGPLPWSAMLILLASLYAIVERRSNPQSARSTDARTPTHAMTQLLSLLVMAFAFAAHAPSAGAGAHHGSSSILGALAAVGCLGVSITTIRASVSARDISARCGYACMSAMAASMFAASLF